jgi:hypothetical protein
MAVSTQSPAPYTAAPAVLAVIRRFREKGLTLPIGQETLLRAGVGESLIPRTMQALQTLELIDDKGQPTPILQNIRSVPQANYQATLGEWLHSVYKDVFAFADPRTDDEVQIRDAFRTYQPHGQQDRMVSLFMGLCAEAGLADESKKAESKLSARKQNVRSASSSTSTAKKSPVQQKTRIASPNILPAIPAELHPALMGLVQSIPKAGRGWTQQDRDKFYQSFGAVLDFAVPIVTAETQTSGADDAN